jgi:hypothetical protein
MEIEGRTPGRGKPYTAQLNLAGVEIRRNSIDASYSWRDVFDTVAFIERHDMPVAFWNKSRQSETLEAFLRARKLNSALRRSK